MKRSWIRVVVVALLLVIAGMYVAYRTQSADAKKETGPVKISQTTEDWQVLETDHFTIMAPAGWKFNQGRGTDSYVGTFDGEGISLEFDYGIYSNSLADDNNPDYTIKYETIDGQNARLVKPVGANGLTGVYFGKLGKYNRLNIYGRDLSESNKELTLRVVRTLKFKDLK